jgi:hypothetical protein
VELVLPRQTATLHWRRSTRGQRCQKRRFGRSQLHVDERWFSSRRATGRHSANSLEAYLCASKKGLKKDSLAGWILPPIVAT